MVKYFCDSCKKKIQDGFAPVSVRVEDKMHEFCNDCWVKLRGLLEGTGIPIVMNNWPLTLVPNKLTGISDWQYMPGNQSVKVDPNSQTIITTSNNSSAFIVSEFLPDGKESDPNQDFPKGYAGILAGLTVEPGSSLSAAIKEHFVRA